MPPATTKSRLERILVLVPWVMAHPGATARQVCERFGITRQDLLADLDLLFVCGLPPFGPGDLIEAYLEEDRVVIRAADYLARPMRLSTAEAAALLVLGRAMTQLPGLGEVDSLRSALAKLERALPVEDAATAEALADRVAIELGGAAEGILSALKHAIAERIRLRIVYYSFGRDALGERSVDPLLVFAALGNWYLVALDHRSQEERVFRVDRIKEMRGSVDRFELPPGFDPQRYAGGVLFTASASDVEAVFEIAPAAAWVLEATPHDRSDRLPDGWTRVSLRTPYLAWLVRLLLRLGPLARAISPSTVSDELGRLAERTLALYASS